MSPPATKPLGWLLAATALAYFNALGAGFQFDDFNVIVDNPAVHGLAAWWAQVDSMRPLLKLGYALNWSSDQGAFGFHLVNLLLHLTNIALVWRLSTYFPRPPEWPAERSDLARLIQTALFALHPIQSEAVTYVSGRSMSQMAMFTLAGLLLWLHADKPQSIRRALALLCFFAAALSKEVALIAPFLLCLFPRALDRRATWILIAASALMTLALFLGLGYQRLLSEPLVRSIGDNLLSELNALFYLLGQLLAPHALNIDPDLPELHGFSSLSALQASVLVAFLLIAWQRQRTWPWLAFGLGWFMLLLLPSHTLIPRQDLASERHLYLASLGLFWIVAALLSSAHWPWLRRTIVLLLITLGGAFSLARNADYRDEISLWQITVTQSPGKARVWNNLGYAYHLAGRLPEARAAYLQALRRDPAYAKARANLQRLNWPMSGSDREKLLDLVHE